jgi:hypothetical protein
MVTLQLQESYIHIVRYLGIYREREGDEGYQMVACSNSTVSVSFFLASSSIESHSLIR